MYFSNTGLNHFLLLFATVDQIFLENDIFEVHVIVKVVFLQEMNMNMITANYV